MLKRWKKPENEQKEKLKLLYIDDCEISRYFFRDFINMDFKKINAWGEEEPLPLEEYQDYGAILIDARLGNKDGIDVAQQIKAIYPDIPGGIMTGLPKSAVVDRLPPGWLYVPKTDFVSFREIFKHVLEAWGLHEYI